MVLMWPCNPTTSYEVPSSVPRKRHAESTGSGSSDQSYESSRTHRRCKEWVEGVEKTRAPTPLLPNPAFVVPYAFSAPMHPPGPAHVAPYAFSAPMRPPGPAHVAPYAFSAPMRPPGPAHPAPYAVPTMMHPPMANPTASYEVPTPIFSSGQMNPPPVPQKRHAESTGSSNRSNKRTRRDDRFGSEEAEATLVSLRGPIQAACDAFIDWYGRLDPEEARKREFESLDIAYDWRLFTQVYPNPSSPEIAKRVLKRRMPSSQAGVTKNANALFELFESAWNVAFGIGGHPENENFRSTHEAD